MLILVVIIAWIAFKRGHNGYVMVFCLLAGAGVGMVLGALIHQEIVYHIMLGLSFLFTLIYCFAVPGNGKDPLKEIDEQHKAPLEKTELAEETEITPEDVVVLKVYTHSWQQSELMDDVEKLRNQGIWHQAHSGHIASVSVRAEDFERAATVIGLEDTEASPS